MGIPKDSVTSLGAATSSVPDHRADASRTQTFSIPDARVLQPSAQLDFAALEPERLQRLRAHLDQLVAQGFWMAGEADDAAGYALPDFDAPPRAPGGLGVDGPWLSLSDPCEDPQIAMLAAALELPPSIAVVVADDALGPRLEVLDRQFRAAGRAWLLRRLAGEHPMVGPLFHAPGTACWSCLAFRMLWNQPVRRWYHRVHPGALAPIPAVWRPEVVEQGLARFATAARHLVLARTGGAMTELAWTRPDLRVHPVIRRPQCSVCGDPELYGRRARAPVALGPAPRTWDEDGGFRTQPTEQTKRALEGILSPVSGLVAGVACQSRSGPDINRIFRAWFGKTTFQPGLPRTGQLFQTTMGKGMSAVQSRVSAISESLERLASSYHGDEPVIRARAGELPGRSFLPAALAPYSEQQVRAFQATGDPRRAAIHAMLPASPDAVLDWTPVWSLTRGEPCFVPFTWCYANTPYDEDHPREIWVRSAARSLRRSRVQRSPPRRACSDQCRSVFTSRGGSVLASVEVRGDRAADRAVRAGPRADPRVAGDPRAHGTPLDLNQAQSDPRWLPASGCQQALAGKPRGRSTRRAVSWGSRLRRRWRALVQPLHFGSCMMARQAQLLAPGPVTERAAVSRRRPDRDRVTASRARE